MSLPRTETIACPKCKKPQEITVWSSINVTTDQNLKRDVLNGSIRYFQCQSCGHSITVESDLLYHDMGRRLAVWLKYPDDEGVFGVDPQAEAIADVFGEDYTRRVVPSYEELLE
jgi:hypothetical protein